MTAIAKAKVRRAQRAPERTVGGDPEIDTLDSGEFNKAVFEQFERVAGLAGGRR